MSLNDLFLGLVQGATEFLPVSSSGHLFLMEKILKGSQSSLPFILFLHLATFLAVLTVFFKDIKSFVLGINDRDNFQLFLKLLLSLAPLVFVGLFFKNFVQESFEKNTVAFGFLSTGLLLASLFFIRSRKNLSLKEMSFLQAFLIGLSQSLAVLPGFSRSAWTIAVGLYCGLSPRSAVYFSFLISLPAILGSGFLGLLPFLLESSSNSVSFDFSTVLSLFLPFLVAFVSGWLCLILILKMAKNQKLAWFSFYLIPLSVLVFFII